MSGPFVTVPVAELAHNLGLAGKSLSKRHTLPVLDCVNMYGFKSSFSLETTDLEKGTKVTMITKVQGEFRALLPHKELYSFIKTLPKKELVTFITDDKNKVAITCGRASASLQGLPSGEYPPTPKFDAAKSTRYTVGREFVQAFQEVEVTSSTDEARPVLTGLSLEFEPDDLVITSTNGHILSTRKVGYEGEPGETLVVPGSLAKLLHGFADANSVSINLAPTKNQIEVKANGTELYCRLIDGKFPNWRQVVPIPNPDQHVSLDRQELLATVERVGKMATDAANAVRFHFTPGALQLEARTAERSDSSEKLSVEGRITARIALNARYVATLLKNLQGDRVDLYLNGDLAPLLMGNGVDGTLAVVMPIRIPA